MDKPLEVKPFPERPKNSQPWEPILLPSNFMRDISSGPQVALVTPQCATRIGQVITAWSWIENTLVEIMAYTIHAEEWVAAELFQDIRQLDLRLKLLLKMLNRKAPQNIEVKKRIKDLFRSLSTISKERNQIAHGNFVYSGEYPETLFLSKGWGKDETIYLYDLATLDALVSKIYEVGEQVMTLSLEVIAIAPQRYETGRWIFPTPVVLSIRPEDLGMPPA